MFITVLILLCTLGHQSHAFYDWLAEEAKDASELAAYSSALGDLIEQIDPDSGAKEYSGEINKRIQKVQSEISSGKNLGVGVQSMLRGPDLSNKRVLDNVKSLTQYLKRLKGILATVGVLGTQGAISINTAETNRHLSEIQKNQQTQLLLLADTQIRQAEQAIEQRKKWGSFLQNERDLRSKSALRKY